MRRIKWLVMISLAFLPGGILAANFSTGRDTARTFGVHEIVLTGDGAVPDPFDISCRVIFTAPSGAAVETDAFYDGGNTWRARCYVREAGEWSWRSFSHDDPALDNQHGTFPAVVSPLRGTLIRHPENPKALATDDGEWFLNIGDTPYFLFHRDKKRWREYLDDISDRGVTMLRAALLGALDDWSLFFAEGNHDTPDVGNFQTNDERLIWMLDHHPELYVELILLPGCNTGYSKDETFWHNLSEANRTRILKYIVARYAAFPEILWQVVNDYKYGPDHPHNVQMVRETGRYLQKNDPWHHLITTGGVRGDPFYFTEAPWIGFIHLETLDALPADQVRDYRDIPVHVFCGEDRYETYRPPDHPQVFFRRLMWSWILSGGSACYGGIWNDIVPYSQSTMKGLDNIRYIRDFFRNGQIDLSGYIPCDNCVSAPAQGSLRPKVMRAAAGTGYVIYHPNATTSGQDAGVSRQTASLKIDDLPPGKYSLVWMRADNGDTSVTLFDHAGGDKRLTAPWPAIDVVLYLRANMVTGMKTLPCIHPEDDENNIFPFLSPLSGTPLKMRKL